MESFNLVTEPWIKVLDCCTNEEKKVSIKELFQNAAMYRQLAGEMHAQDLAILRLLEAILITVYTRIDSSDQPYDWVTLDEKMHLKKCDQPSRIRLMMSLVKTWQNLYEAGHFSNAVFKYLDRNIASFDFFGKKPFYQVTAEQYDSFVPDNKKIAKNTGTVSLMQINRLVSESGNSIAIFSPKSPDMKNKMPMDELVRWVITYQNFAGVTDKTKAQLKIKTKDKMPNSRGWLYTLNPVFVQGKNLFETFMLNMLLFNPSRPLYVPQRPVWEEQLTEYVKKRLTQIKPDNFAETYSVWARLLYIEWKDENPKIFSAGLPPFESGNTFDIEPMSIWRKGKKDEIYYPATRQLNSVGRAMWHNFGQYVGISSVNESQKPMCVDWLNYLKDQKIIGENCLINLHTSGIISNGGATSLSPAVEFDDNLRIEADVLFDQSKDKKNIWPVRIEEMVELNQEVGRKYYRFLMEVGQIRFGEQKAEDYAGRQSQVFYNNLNEPFMKWLSGLTVEDDREVKQKIWKQELRKIALKVLDDFLDIIAPRDISGKEGNNIFIAANKYRAGINNALNKR